MFTNVFKDKKVLVTGHTGFKGSWLSLWLTHLGARVAGYALDPYTHRDNFVVTRLREKVAHAVGDLRDADALMAVFQKEQPEFVFHLAAQPIVRQSYVSPKETFDINVGGSVNVLECCRHTDSVKVIVNITSDKCYENREWVWGYRESDRMGGHDPYSASKGCAELVSASYARSFFRHNSGQGTPCLATVRAGNVIGGGDWQKDRIIPDCIRALEADIPIEIRNPKAVRPWQHVLEPLNGYLLLASKMYESPDRFHGGWNFGPNFGSVISVDRIADLAVKFWGGGSWVNVQTEQAPHEAGLLNLDISKASFDLGWSPVWGIEETVKKTMEWYKLYSSQDPYTLCIDQIREFQATRKKGIENE